MMKKMSDEHYGGQLWPRFRNLITHFLHHIQKHWKISLTHSDWRHIICSRSHISRKIIQYILLCSSKQNSTNMLISRANLVSPSRLWDTCGTLMVKLIEQISNNCFFLASDNTSAISIGGAAKPKPGMLQHPLLQRRTATDLQRRRAMSRWKRGRLFRTRLDRCMWRTMKRHTY